MKTDFLARRIPLLWLLAALAVGFYAGWQVQAWLHEDDVCDFAVSEYEYADSNLYQNLSLPDGSDYERYLDLYGDAAADAIMDAHLAGARQPASFLRFSVLDACGQLP